ncbi:MAG: asparagine synthase-related protein [Aliarcobacter sp.]|nr:asparagine synthase-related protein [Aliarcobacter sp.]
MRSQVKKRYYINKIFYPDFKDFITTNANSYINSVTHETIKEKQLELIESGYHQERLESWAVIGKKAGINYLYPLLDKRIVEFTLSIPGDLYYKDGTNRYLYRKVIEHFVPKFLHTKLKPPEIYRVTHLLKEKKDALKKLDYERVLKQVKLPYIDEEMVLKILKEIDIESDDKILNIEKLQSLSSVYFALMIKQR